MLDKGSTAPSVTLSPVFGREIALPAALRDGPLVVVFVGALASPQTRGVLAELQELYSTMDRQGTRLVAVTGTALAHAQDFVPRFHVLYPLVVDPDGAHRRAFGLTLSGGVRQRWRNLVDGARGLRMVARWGRGLPEPGVPGQVAWFRLDTNGCVTAAGLGAPGPDDVLARAEGEVRSSSG